MNHIEVNLFQTEALQAATQGIDNALAAEAPGEWGILGHDDGRTSMLPHEAAQKVFGFAKGVDLGRIKERDTGIKGDVECRSPVKVRLLVAIAPESGADAHGPNLGSIGTKLQGWNFFLFHHFGCLSRPHFSSQLMIRQVHGNGLRITVTILLWRPNQRKDDTGAPPIESTTTGGTVIVCC